MLSLIILMGQPIPNLAALDVYRPRNPRASAYYQCVQNHFEELDQVWDERYASHFGFWRSHIKDVIHRYLDCGDLHCGFARVKCAECGKSICCHFLASGGIFALPAIRREWLNTGNGC
jgi:hypothetical protein